MCSRYSNQSEKNQIPPADVQNQLFASINMQNYRLCLKCLLHLQYTIFNGSECCYSVFYTYYNNRRRSFIHKDAINNRLIALTGILHAKIIFFLSLTFKKKIFFFLVSYAIHLIFRLLSMLQYMYLSYRRLCVIASPYMMVINLSKVLNKKTIKVDLKIQIPSNSRCICKTNKAHVLHVINVIKHKNATLKLLRNNDAPAQSPLNLCPNYSMTLFLIVDIANTEKIKRRKKFKTKSKF